MPCVTQIRIPPRHRRRVLQCPFADRGFHSWHHYKLVHARAYQQSHENSGSKTAVNGICFQKNQRGIRQKVKGQRNVSNKARANQIKQFMHPWFENRDGGSRGIHARDLEIQRASEGNTSKACEGQIEDCKVGGGDWFEKNFEWNTDSTCVNYQSHQQVFQSHPQPTKVLGTTSIMEPPIDRADQHDRVSHTGSSITAQSWSDRPDQSWQHRGQGRRWAHSQNSWDQTDHHAPRWHGS